MHGSEEVEDMKVVLQSYEQADDMTYNHEIQWAQIG